MSTRGFLALVADGEEKTAYNHSDSYPSGLGVDVLTWLRIACGEDVDALAERVRALRVVDRRSEPTDEDIERLGAFLRADVGGRRERPDWYQLLRETQGNPATILQAGVIEDSADFPLDSLFAEWGYVVDLDAQMFEVYRGFQREPHDKGRYAQRPSNQDGYAPVALVAAWPLSELPTDEDFVATVEGGDQG